MTKSLLLRALESVQRKWPPAGEIDRKTWADRFDGESRKRFSQDVIHRGEALGLIIVKRVRNVSGRPRVTLWLHPGIKRGIYREAPYNVTR